MNEKNKDIYAKGLFFNDPSENAPDFVIGKLSIQVDDFAKWANEQEKNEKGYVSIEILRSREDKKPYAKLDTWKKS